MKKILIVLIVTLLFTTGCGCDKKNDSGGDVATKEPIVENNNKDVVKDQEVEVFSFKNTSLKFDPNLGTDGTSTLITEVTNTSEDVQKLENFLIHVKDKDGNIIVDLYGFVGDQLLPGEMRTIESSSTINLSKAESITYEVVR